MWGGGGGAGEETHSQTSCWRTHAERADFKNRWLGAWSLEQVAEDIEHGTGRNRIKDWKKLSREYEEESREQEEQIWIREHGAGRRN